MNSRDLRKFLISRNGLSESFLFCSFLLLSYFQDESQGMMLKRISYLFHDIISLRFFGEPFGLIDKGGDLYCLLRAAQEGANVVHALARLPWLKRFLFDGFLGRWLAPKAGDGSAVGELLEVSASPIHLCIGTLHDSEIDA